MPFVEMLAGILFTSRRRIHLHRVISLSGFGTVP
jgi:hypothetical protein